MAPPASTHAARRPLITAWLHCLASLATGFASRPLEIPEGFLRVCVLPRRRQRPPANVRTYGTNHCVTIDFKQSIAANDALRTGSYGKTLTFTLSTTNP